MIIHYKYKSLYWDEKKSKWKHLLKSRPAHKEQCHVKRCKNFTRMNYRNGKLRMWNMCNKCTSRMKRANNPISYMFKELRHSAKRRKILFELTFQDFVLFCNENDYTARQCSDKSSMTTIDRINSNLGYTYTNIQMLSNGENVAKGNTERHDHDSNSNDDPF